VLRELGFTVEKIGETRPDPMERRDLTAEEVSLIVADYFDMLRLDLAGQEFVKAEWNRAMQERLNGTPFAQNGAGRADSWGGHRAPGNGLRINGASRQNRCAPCCAIALRPCRPLSQGSWSLRSVTWTKPQFGVGDFSDFVPDFS
jgi:hypothetical protein